MRENVSERTGFLFDGALEDIDPATSRVTAFEEARQISKLVMIASESAAPQAVREALASVFTDLYAEGYPAARMSHEPEDLLADVPYQAAYHQRYSDRRYYKGTEFADIVEALAQDRIRALFAPNRYPSNNSSIGADQIQANVQPLSGANANTAVYFGLLQPGDTIMGLNLAHGGHLSHGSPVNISGKLFKVVSYGVDPATGRIDYDEAERLALEHNPRMVVAGASAYPWFIDFARLRRICDALPKKAYLLADVSHPAGLVVAGLFPNPVGIADVTTFTTHKTLIGPRAAVILTTNEILARRIDRAVFPGLQGGPHINTIAALAVAFKIAQSPAFNELQSTIVKNAVALAETLARRGLTIGYGGTESHLLMIDLRTIATESRMPLNGDVAARILDLAGVVCNKNTIAGDLSANFPNGIRLGTPWITQRGLTPADMVTLGGIIADVLLGIRTFFYFDRDDSAARGKISAEVLKKSQAAIADLIARRAIGPEQPAGWPGRYLVPAVEIDGRPIIELRGKRAMTFLDQATSADVTSLVDGEAIAAEFLDGRGTVISRTTILRMSSDEFGLQRFSLAVDAGSKVELEWWIESLSSGLVQFDDNDPWAKIDGPVAIRSRVEPLTPSEESAFRLASDGQPTTQSRKPFFIGQFSVAGPGSPGSNRPIFPLPSPSGAPLSHDVADTIARVPDGWSMPATYGDAASELKALREGAGLVDVSALGISEIAGPDARRLLDLVTTNDVSFLGVGGAQFTFLLDQNGQTITDGILYRLSADRFWLTTAPAWTARVGAWLRAAVSGTYLVDPNMESRTLPASLTIRDVHGAEDGDDGFVAIALAGPNALAILRLVADTADERRKLGRIRRFNLAAVRLAGASAVVARTGHTGGTNGYEIFVSRERVSAVWNSLLAKGADLGARPVGWDAWRTAGIVAGLPYVGHEIAGPERCSPVAAGFGREVQIHKPFFVGRQSLLDRPYPPASEIIRFRYQTVDEQRPTEGNSIMAEGGERIGTVTSVAPLPDEPIGLGEVRRSAIAAGTRISFARAGDIGTTCAGEVLTRFPK